MDLYFDCSSGISGDMSVAALLDVGGNKEKLEKALDSVNLNNEFQYKISRKVVNAIMATDFDVILPEHNHLHDLHNEPHSHHVHYEHHEHRNLADVNSVIEASEADEGAKNLAKKIFKIVAEAEAKVHGKSIEEVHFHEVGAIDSIADILGFSVLFEDLKPDKVYFSTLTEGSGFAECQHGKLPVPVPAVCEIAARYKLPLKITANEGEMVTPTGAAIAAALYEGGKLSEGFVIQKVGYGAGKRAYENPLLRVMLIDEKGE